MADRSNSHGTAPKLTLTRSFTADDLEWDEHKESFVEDPDKEQERMIRNHLKKSGIDLDKLIASKVQEHVAQALQEEAEKKSKSTESRKR